VAAGKSLTEARREMPLDSGNQVDIPDRAEAALSRKTLVSEWGIPPWEHDQLTCKDMQDIRLAERAEAYMEQEQRERQQRQQAGKNGRRSARNSERYQDYQQRMQEQYGGLN